MKPNSEHDDSAPIAQTMTDEEINSMVEQMLVEDFGLPKVIPENHLPKLQNPALEDAGSKMTEAEMRALASKIRREHMEMPDAEE